MLKEVLGRLPRRQRVMSRHYRHRTLVKFLKWSGTALCLLSIFGLCIALLERARYLPEDSSILSGFSTSGILGLICAPIAVCVLPTLLLWLVDYGLSRSSHDSMQPGHCQRCGYDLTGNVSGICPECGTPIPEPLEDAPRSP